MTDLLKQGSRWLEGMRVAHASRPVVYVRGADSVEVSATIGRTIFSLDQGYSVIERVETRDYLVLAADLVIGGVATLPRAGDRIREVEGNKAYVYEVMAPGNEPCWRYSDPYRKTLRIHTKHVATEDV
ncbi:MAG: hypothetical protein V1809_01895 [Planctomycetota bacterium]